MRRKVTLLKYLGNFSNGLAGKQKQNKRIFGIIISSLPVQYLLIADLFRADYACEFSPIHVRRTRE